MGHGGDAVLKRWGNICDDAMVFSVTFVTCCSTCVMRFFKPFCHQFRLRLGALTARANGHRTGLPFIHGTTSPLASSLQKYTA